MVSLCSCTLALTADLTAERTEEEHGVRLTVLLPVRQAATPVQNEQCTQLWRGSQSERELESERDGFNHTNLNMHKLIHKGAAMPVRAQIQTCMYSNYNALAHPQ